jgi:ABC-type transporter Mla subunit MlaD
MASAEIIFLRQARRARDRAKHYRTLVPGTGDPDLIERIEALARELDDTAAQLEKTASSLRHSVLRTGDLVKHFVSTVEAGRELVRRLKKSLDDAEH